MRSRIRGMLASGTLAMAVVAATVTVGSVPARAQAGLPKLDITAVYVTGVSSGGFMATQLQVAYSATVDGVGIIAAGPYDCGQGNVIGFATCNIGASLPALEQQAATWSTERLIDPVSHLAGKPVYVYHGTLDPVVNDLVANSGVDFYQHFGASVEYHSSDPAGHGWPAPDGVLPCPLTSPPFLVNCGDDPEGAMLTHWLGSIRPPGTGGPQGTLSSFSQDPYAPGGDAPALSMDGTGLLYTPPACASGNPCKLVVALHGCLSGQYLLGDEFPELANLDTYADTNNLVILYPQAIASITLFNPEGCWDWWGYDGPDFAVKGAPQMVTIMHMVSALGGGL
ncbi:MAG TPA: PHB depolymerase family esterase [Streptosporangiaceae bacterium]|nr:PHB depolymerase family esterase [Streptosporangiaceae bacterium]